METDEALRCLKALSERGAKPALSEQRAMFTHLLEAPQPYCRRFRDHAIGLLQPQEDVGTPDLWARWVRLLAEKGEPQDLKVLLQLGRGLNEEIWPGTTLGAEMLHRLQWLQWTQERGSEWLTALERAGLDMKKTRYKGAALFHAAAIHGSDTVVAWSLRCGAEVNALDENGFSAMAHAFRRGADPALVSPLSCAGADWDWRDGEGNSLLHVYRPRTWGRMCGALSRELLNDHPRLLEARNRNGHTPLDAECVKLAQKAHSRDAYLKAVLLLRLQAPLTINDNVLDRAFPRGTMDDDARLLLERAQWERDIASFQGRTEVNALDEHGWSALAHAFRRGGHPVLVDPLDRAGADWDWRDREGNTLLHVYQPCTWGRMGEAFSTNLLREHSHLMGARNHSGLTPLDAECVNLAQSFHTPGSCLKASLLLRHQAPLTVDDSVLDQAFPKGTLDDEDRILLERARWHRDCAPPMPARRLRF